MMDLFNYSWQNPHFLWLLLLLPLMIIWLFKRYQQQFADLKVSSLEGIKSRNSWKGRLRPMLNLLKLLAFAFLVIAMARPQSSRRQKTMPEIPRVAQASITCSGDHPAPCPSSMCPRVAVFNARAVKSLVKSRTAYTPYIVSNPRIFATAISGSSNTPQSSACLNKAT